eukprot:359715-Chlamydomonas_euryale.AAC.1
MTKPTKAKLQTGADIPKGSTLAKMVLSDGDVFVSGRQSLCCADVHPAHRNRPSITSCPSVMCRCASHPRDSPPTASLPSLQPTAALYINSPPFRLACQPDCSAVGR